VRHLGIRCAAHVVQTPEFPRAKFSQCEDAYGDEFSDWRSELRATAFIESHIPGEKLQEIGCGIAYIVDRPSIRGDWWGLMDGPDEEFQEFSTVLFDKRGFFRKELYEHPTKKGTGVFGPELGKGIFLYIQYIRVEAKYRRQGIGKKLVEGLQALAEQNVSILITYHTYSPLTITYSFQITRVSHYHFAGPLQSAGTNRLKILTFQSPSCALPATAALASQTSYAAPLMPLILLARWQLR
jgi:GNAT superfamily N-acetyltransferase